MEKSMEGWLTVLLSDLPTIWQLSNHSGISYPHPPITHSFPSLRLRPVLNAVTETSSPSQKPSKSNGVSWGAMKFTLTVVMANWRQSLKTRPNRNRLPEVLRFWRNPATQNPCKNPWRKSCLLGQHARVLWPSVTFYDFLQQCSAMFYSIL